MKFMSGLIAVLFAVVASFVMMPEADAKRLGGGGSVGKSYNYSKPAKPQSTPQRDQASSMQGSGAASAPARGGMMGPLAGLAAGGLLGAMFFGGAFEGLQIFDFLIFALLAAGIFMLVRHLRRGSASTVAREAPVAAGAGAAGYHREAPVTVPPASNTRTSTRTFAVPEIGSGLGERGVSTRPGWFNERAFMAEVDQHFMTLQRAWDAGDWASLEEYVTADMLAHLQSERAALSAAPSTQVTRLQSELLDLIQDGDEVVAAILFHGDIAEDGAAPVAFSEVWHVVHPATQAEGDWRLAGIAQYTPDPD
ncbi:MAG: Tim44 domain-containing protein [Thiotrichales bacterium]